jgi:hypothetical protein
MPIEVLDLQPTNSGAPFAVAIRQPSGSVNRPTVIIRARMQVRLQGILYQAMVEVGRRVVESPAIANAQGQRWVAVGAVPGADRYEVECNVADLLQDGIVLQTGPYLALDEPLTWIDYTPSGLVLGGSTSAVIDITPASAGVLSVGIEQDDTSTDDVLVTIEASTEAGYVEVGRRVFPAPSPGPGKRFVALLAIPGSLSYRVTARSQDGARPYLQIGPYKNLSEPLTWIVGGVPVPPGAGAQPASLIWVATNGDDATGERGNLDRPFASVQAAVDAAQQGDSVLISPGDYFENVTIPPTLSMTLAGLGEIGFVRIAPPSGSALVFNPDADNQLSLRNLELISSDPVPAVLINATAPVNSAVFSARDVVAQSAGAAAVFASGLEFYYVSGCFGDFSFEECNGGYIFSLNGAFSDVVSEPTPANVSRNLTEVTGARMPVATVAGNARVEFTASCFADLIDHGSLGFLAAAGEMVFRGECRFTTLAALSDLARFDFRASEITGELIFANLSANPITFDAQGATVRQFDIAALPGDTTLDTRGGNVANVGSSAAVGPFFWDRDGGADRVTLSVVGANVLTFGVDLAGYNYPSGSQPVFSVTPTDLPVLPGEAVTASTLTNTGFTALNGYPGPQDVSITYTRETVLPCPKRSKKRAPQPDPCSSWR